MAMQGHRDYKSREFCNGVQCPVQIRLNAVEKGSEEYEKIREVCRTDCRHSAHEFHYWLIGKGFLIVKPEEEREVSE